jgi:diaminopimelate epimerase
MKIPFIKMHGAGNDFVFLSREKTKVPVTPALAEKLLDRHFGIGGDQLLVLDGEKTKTPSLKIFNSDGSQAEMCGNGVRAVGFYLKTKRGVKKSFVLKTKAGPIGIGLSNGAVDVDMGPPRSAVVIRAITVGGKKFQLHCVSMGNPHAVVYVKDVKNFPVTTIGPLIENHPYFPKRVNVEFVQVLSSSHVRARVWERGAGETLACGTGACAIAVASARFGKTGRSIKIDLPGGQLRVRWEKNNHVYLSGPAEVTYEGEFYV